MSESLPPNWQSYTTDEGKDYYHNVVTGVTQWERPMPETMHDSAADVYRYVEPAGLGASTVSHVSESQRSYTSTTQGDSGVASVSLGLNDHEMVSLTGPELVPSGNMGAPTSSQGSAGAASGSSKSFFGGVLSAAAGDGGEGGSRVSGVGGWLLETAQCLFDVSTQDVVNRLRLVLLPKTDGSTPAAAEELRTRPDFYGPFWVATTAVLFLPMTGNFARLLQAADRHHFKADYSLVTLAATIIYGCLLAVPLVARVALMAAGEEVQNFDMRQTMCICGYALSPVIPASVLCIFPFSFVRWLAVMAGLGLSLYFLYRQLLSQISVGTPWLKYTMLGLPCATQVLVFFIYRIHFF